MEKLKELFICLLVLAFLNWLYLYPKMKCDGNECNSDHDQKQLASESRSKNPLTRPLELLSEAVMQKLQEKETKECSIPILDPFNPIMTKQFKNKVVHCSRQKQKYYFQVNEREEGDSAQEIIMVERIPKNMGCCFIPLRFKENKPYGLIKDDDPKPCKYITQKLTRVPDNSQFVLIKCWNNMTTTTSISNSSLTSPPQNTGTFTEKFSHDELLIFVPHPSKRLLQKKDRLLLQRKSNIHPKLNIIILGFDQTSRLNFIRQMNHAFKYLISGLEAIDLHGYNKIGDATLNNTLGFLTGHDFGSVMRNKKWWDPNITYFDKLPWIWKNFSNLGYITSMADDFVSVFDYRFKGFKNKPTDYYIQPLINWLRHDVRGTHHSRLSELSTSPLCTGREVTFDLLQNYAKKTSMTLQDHPYFQFVWNSAIHEKMEYPSMADNGIVSTLKHFNSSGILNRSLVILLSDHGWRTGSIMSFSQARIENKMPFAFLLLPKWFKEVYPKAYENVHENQHRLTTPYDIHSTLVDLLDPETTLTDDSIFNPPLNPHPFGISLFRPVLKNRTCQNAGIDEVWCACSNYKVINSKSNKAQKLASFAVDTINSWLKPFNSCVQYTLDSVIQTEVKVSSKKSYELSERNTFRVVLTVATHEKSRPGFEVVVFTESGWTQTTRDFYVESKFMKMSTEVFRLTYYGSAPCMKVYALKKICTCM